MLAVKVELPQLLATTRVGVGGTVNGAVVPLLAALVQPTPLVCVTVNVPAVATVMEVVIAPVLHKSEPVKLPAVKTELPQLSITETVGVVGTAFGDAAALLLALMQPLALVCVTE